MFYELLPQFFLYSVSIVHRVWPGLPCLVCPKLFFFFLSFSVYNTYYEVVGGPIRLFYLEDMYYLEPCSDPIPSVANAFTFDFLADIVYKKYHVLYAKNRVGSASSFYMD